MKMSLKWKLLLLSSIILSISIALIVAYNYYNAYKYAMDTHKYSQISSIRSVTTAIEYKLDVYRYTIETFAAGLNNIPHEEIDSLVESFIKNISNKLDIASVTVYFENGHTINKSRKQLNHTTNRAVIEKGIAEQKLYIADAFVEKGTNAPYIEMLFPVRAENGEKGTAVFICSFEFDEIFNLFTNKNLMGRFHIINKDNIITATLEKKLLMSNVDKAFSNNMVEFINNVKRGNIPDTERISFKGPSQSNRIGVVKKINDYDFYAVYAESEDKAIAYVKSMAAKSIVFGIILLVISNIITMFAVSIPLKNLKYLKKQITKAAENKDLNTVIEVKSNDELAEITKSVNVFIKSIKEVVNEVRSSVIEVASANNQLAATMEQLYTTFNSQSSQVSAMVNSMEDISSISKKTSDALAENMSSLKNTAEATTKETEKLDKVSGEMQLIEKDTISLSDTIQHLSESSAHIGSILNVINDIADQTNLLALNAAIEAARAGDAGKGFAVVADEVRKLAERTQNATKEISNIINELLNDANNASNAMNKSASSVHEGTSNINNAAYEIKKAVENVTLLYQSMNPVSEAVSEQYLSTQKVVDNAQVIAAGIEESNAAVNEVNNTVCHIQQRTERLKNLIEQFKTNR